MRSLLVLLSTVLLAAVAAATDATPKDLVTQLYQAHRSKHDPLVETRLLDRYFDAPLLKLYLRDKQEAKGEVGRLDGDPLYNAQDIEISRFSISSPETAKGEAHITVRFKNMGKPTSVIYVLIPASAGWRISDIRYDDGSSLKKILQAPN